MVNSAKSKFLAYSSKQILYGPLPPDIGLSAASQGLGSRGSQRGEPNTLQDCMLLALDDSYEVLQIQFSQTSHNYIYILAHSNEPFKQCFFVVNMDDDNRLARKAGNGCATYSLSEICEQEYLIPAQKCFTCFLQNSNSFSASLNYQNQVSPLSPYEIMFFTEAANGRQGEVYTLCPVIPK